MTKKPVRKDEIEYIYYSKVLKQPFESVEELREAEAAYFAEIKAKEDKAATKKADAVRVEDAFKALNQARKDYKTNLVELTNLYQQDLKNLKANFENDRTRIQTALADAEAAYSATLKEFTEKYPEGYHITLKDGDFETTISGSASKAKEEAAKVFDLIDYLFRF
jgi:chromosome segregation ATPase